MAAVLSVDVVRRLLSGGLLLEPGLFAGFELVGEEEEERAEEDSGLLIVLMTKADSGKQPAPDLG